MNLRRCGVLLTAALVLLPSSLRDANSREENPAKGRIVATYRVDLAGLKLGEFQLTAVFKGSAYEMEAEGQFSLLAGLLYRASGTTKSAGRLTRARPEPLRFTLRYKGPDKWERRHMRFKAGTVSQVSIAPRKKRNPRRHVPVTKQQLVDALDPLTAAFLYVRSDGRRDSLAVCHQTVPVFDGKQRFDLVLTPKRVDSLAQGPAGLSGAAAVCRVKFVPLGGYRPDHPGIKFMTETDEIEVSLVSLPRTPLYLPYRVSIPTAWGAGSATLTEIKTDLDGWVRASLP